ncbi:lantibiotic dehydratase [Streptomyces sp. NPDC003299]
MIRVSAFPLAAALPSWPPLSDGGSADATALRTWIERVWEDDARAAAIELAAPVLADGVERTLSHSGGGARTIRTATSLMRYLLRMQYRATPFGLFAGPAPLRLGTATSVRFGTHHRAFSGADAVWLHDIITALESDPNVLSRLRVIADPTCTVRGARIEIAHQPGLAGPTQTRLRRTRTVEKALALAQSPVTVADIVDKLHAEYPEAPVETITAMVAELVAHRVLLTNLHAPMTSTDPLGHLLEQLEAIGAAPLVATFPTLQRAHRLLQRHDQAAPAEQRALRREATSVMTALTGVAEGSLAVNLRPDCDVVLPDIVAREAAAALETIARITPFPNGAPAWTDYRTRFLERYSMGTVVPVRELTDPDTGLGFPVGYRGTILKRPVLATTPRDEYLLTLAQNAAISDQRVISLTEDDIAALCVGEPAQVPAHVELCFTVLARSPRELDEGRFNLSLVGLSLAAGTLTGRFLSLLEPADRARVAAAYATLPTLTEGAERVQVSGPPLKVPTCNVSRAPAVVARLLSVGEHNPDATLDLDDLGVVADARRLSLVTLSTGQLLEPSVMNAVELTNATHPLVRFVCELHRSHSAVLIPFPWGAASRLPFLPEIRLGRTILAPACWRLARRDLGDGPDWRRNLTDWRMHYGLPDTVHMGSDDRRLRLDLNVPAHQYLLRTELKRRGTLVLHEAPPESSFDWIGHAHEVTMAFTSDQPKAAPAHPTAVYSRGTARLPGASPWAYLKLYGTTDRATEVLTVHLPRLLLDFGSNAPDAWFIRYADPDSHLRLRLRLASANAFGDAASRIAAWAAELRHEGLIQRVQWDTDEPETGRYGSGAVLQAAERYFAADSAAAIAQLVMPTDQGTRLAITAASMVDIATGFLGSPETGWTWLTQNFLKNEGETCPRDVQALALRLADPGASAATLRGLPRGAHVAGVWALRRRHLAAYRQALALEEGGRDPAGVLPSLLHMHHNRIAGIDPSAEAACRRLARTAALSWTTRAQGDPR